MTDTSKPLTPEQLATWKRLADAATKGSLMGLAITALIAEVERLRAERDALKEAFQSDINFLSQLASVLVNKNSGAFKCAWTDYGEKLMKIVARKAKEANHDCQT